MALGGDQNVLWAIKPFYEAKGVEQAREHPLGTSKSEYGSFMRTKHLSVLIKIRTKIAAGTVKHI